MGKQGNTGENVTKQGKTQETAEYSGNVGKHEKAL